jgi:FkbM family methyltransferase
MNELIVVDVGAASGEFSKFIYKQRSRIGNDHLRVIAIEPILGKAQKIKDKYSGIEVLQCGIRNVQFEQKENFFIHANQDLSSFKNFNPDLDEVMWKEHLSGFSHGPGVEVKVKSLELVMTELKLKKIDFLKIDTQGIDLEVLESAGRFINKINAVVLEFPYYKKSQLYKDEILLVDAINRLSELNFVPARVIPNGAGECNLFAFREGFGLEAYWDLENRLNLSLAPVLKITSVRSKFFFILYFKHLFKKLIVKTYILRKYFI